MNQEAEYLAKEQHEIHLICGRRKPTESTQTYYKSIHTIPLERTQQAFLSIPVRKAAKKYLKIIKEIQPDIIHAHDLMAANVDSFILSEVTKFIFDDHEIWEFLRRQAEATKNILKKIIVKGIQFLTKSINKKVARKADLIVVINER
ncbi:MAG: glycosyltransferase [Candidatus Heimdallarchaeota archaeon]|nr:glycosyltransferase [Candidatus Heimdallarchaeota archaeon]MBY8995182.1 glycosyltransferase [Candidatus Heimdallarchaeota archaeon]